MELMKKVNFNSIFRKLLLMPIPIFLMPFGIACYYACGLGADPFSIFVDGEHVLTGLTYGQITTYNNIVLLFVMVLFGRKYLHVGTVITSFTMGPLIDMSLNLLRVNFPAETTPLILNIIILIVGCVLFGVGVGVYISISLGVGLVEFISLFIVDHTKISIKYVRIGLDGFFTAVGFLMGGVVGIGTLLGVLATGPIVEYTMKLVSKPINSFTQPIKGVAAMCGEQSK